MAKEIERKFLVCSDSYRTEVSESHDIRQAYLSTGPTATVRIRIKDDRAYLTVKSRNRGLVRDEWEYEIPKTDAEDMIERCHNGPVISKTRHLVGRWEIDEFHGELEGLVLAEIELSRPDEPFDIPPFIGREVSGDPRYYNSMLALHGRPG